MPPVGLGGALPSRLMIKPARMIAALLALVLLFAACSGDDDETSTDESSTTETSESTTTASTEPEDDESTTTTAADDGDDADTTAAADADADAGDGDGTGDGDDSGATGAGDADDAAVADNAGITILGVSFDSGTVTVRNDSDAAIDFAGYYTCNRPAYAEMPAETLEPGATLDIDVTDLDIRASGGEFGLYSSRSFDSADAMVAYVQWGGPGNGRAATAVEAGLIEEGEFIDNGGEDIVLE